MNPFSKIHMTDSSRLARKQQLAKAMAVVRSSLANASSWTPPNFEGAGQQRSPTSVVDIVRRSLETANTWMPTQLSNAPIWWFSRRHSPAAYS